jgi:hypothetical protein
MALPTSITGKEQGAFLAPLQREEKENKYAGCKKALPTAFKEKELFWHPCKRPSDELLGSNWYAMNIATVM